MLEASGSPIIQSPRLTHTSWNDEANNNRAEAGETGAPGDGERSNSRIDRSKAAGMATALAEESLWSSQIKEYHDNVGEARPERQGILSDIEEYTETEALTVTGKYLAQPS